MHLASGRVALVAVCENVENGFLLFVRTLLAPCRWMSLRHEGAMARAPERRLYLTSRRSSLVVRRRALLAVAAIRGYCLLETRTCPEDSVTQRVGSAHFRRL